MPVRAVDLHLKELRALLQLYVRLKYPSDVQSSQHTELRAHLGSCANKSSCSIDTMAQYSFMLLALAQTTALKVFGTPGRGPAIQRVYPSTTSVKVEYWLGAGQLTSCTVDDVRGLQKCVKVVSAAVYTDEEDFESGRFGRTAGVCGADVWVPFRVMGEASSLDEVAACFETAAAGDYFVGRRSRGAVAARHQKKGAESGAIAEGAPRRVQRARQGPEEPRHFRPLGR